MKDAYPELQENSDRVSTSLEAKRQDSLAPSNEGLGPLEMTSFLRVLGGSSGQA